MTATIDPNSSPFMTVAEIATYLRTSKMTVYRLVEEGTLKAVRIHGRTIRIETESLVEYLKENKV